MLKLIGRWLKIYENEIGLFLWTAALLFLVRSSGMILNNYAETAFLKRFGVEYLPIVNMINAVATFLVMGFLVGLMDKLSSARLLFYLFLFCGMSVTVIRLLIPLGIDFVYPVLFMLKAQFEVLLALLFWNLANDLFNTRQSKRLFPLVTAGGVIGLILGSFGTPFLAKTIAFDNLLFVYLGICLAGAVVVKSMSGHFPVIMMKNKPALKKGKRNSMIDEFKRVLPLLKESTLVKILIVLTFTSNVVVPIMNYQFNFAINEQFATEGGMLQFFGYFRGFLNIISLIILLFVGRIYGRWGLPVALMFHPFNYMIALFAFLFRFDLFSAMYARMSTNILRTTINIPANAILMGLFPKSYRNLVRPFLRGTVVRMGLFLGSGLILISNPFFHPRYLSLVALPFVLTWIIGPFVLKKRYSNILLDMVSKNMLDLKSMEEEDVMQLFSDKQIREQLIQSFLSAKGDSAVWYAKLLKSLSIEGLDGYILEKIESEDDQTKMELMPLLTPAAEEAAIRVFKKISDPQKPDLMKSMVQAANRFHVETVSDFIEEVFEKTKDPTVKAYAVAGLSRLHADKYREMINRWLTSKNETERKAGIIAAQESGDNFYVAQLKQLLIDEPDAPLVPDILRGFRGLKVPDINELAMRYLSHSLASVRLAALDIFEIEDDKTLKKALFYLGDSSEAVSQLAKDRIENAPYHNGRLLFKFLGTPHRKYREGLFALLESLEIKDLDAIRYVRSQIEIGYRYLIEIKSLRLLPESPKRDLLIKNLDQEKVMKVENTLRILGLQDRSGQMKIVRRGIFSSDQRQRSNSQEALEDLLDYSLSKIMLPLLEDISLDQQLVTGKKYFKLMAFNGNQGALFSHLLVRGSWVTALFTLDLVEEIASDDIKKKSLEKAMTSENLFVRERVNTMMKRDRGGSIQKEKDKESQLSITDKILYLKGIEIFEELSVGELSAIASVSEEVDSKAGEIVIRENDPGDTLYLIISGEVTVIKGMGGENEFELDRINEGDYFGEMALFEDVVRSASIRTEKISRFLVLHKQEFKEIVREYPQIALHICKILSGRLRRLHKKLDNRSNENGSS